MYVQDLFFTSGKGRGISVTFKLLTVLYEFLFANCLWAMLNVQNAGSEAIKFMSLLSMFTMLLYILLYFGMVVSSYFCNRFYIIHNSYIDLHVVDIDECLLGNHACHSNTTSCTNTVGSFICTATAAAVQCLYDSNSETTDGSVIPTIGKASSYLLTLLYSP